eukprot:TRINITY_DN1580_c0_g1_i3.p1 TRINITY_DN1580_c0_g1~~TRINITY_DN1580_c0_g1_i3.p1  ORF type:complete len:340 (+),score=89.93 TRINITY_DN1580_c0_g1_i3:109-1128(+)
MQKQSFEARRQRALESGIKFVKDFFNKLSGSDIKGAADMYAKDGVYLDWKDTYEGEKAIKDFYTGLKGQRKFSFTSLVCQPSVDDCVLVCAHGVQLTREENVSFSRTFFIVKSVNGYCIQNDVLELKKVDECVPSTTTPVVAAAKPETVKTSAKPSVSTPQPTPQETPAPAALGTSWADKLKSSVPAATVVASAPQRVVGGTQKEDGEKDDKSDKKDKKQPASSTGDRKPKDGSKEDKDKKNKKRSKSPTEKYQYAALYVSHIPTEMTEADVEKIFSKFGKIKGRTFKAGQYCFIDFDDKGSVKAACTEPGQTLTVQERKSPEQRAAEKLRKEKDKKRK